MQLKIASYNVRKAVGLDRRRDPARILNILNDIGADIVPLQEADRRLGARPTAIPRALIERETDYAVVELAKNEVSLGWHGNAVLVRRGLEVVSTRHIELPGLEPRGAVFARVGRLSIVGTHLGLMRRWRHRQMNAILSHIGPTPGPRSSRAISMNGRIFAGASPGPTPSRFSTRAGPFRPGARSRRSTASPMGVTSRSAIMGW